MFLNMKWAKILLGITLGASFVGNALLFPHLQRLKNENAAFASQLQDLKLELKKLETERLDLSQKFETEKKSLLSDIDMLKAEITDLKQTQSTNYKDDIRRLTDENKTLNKKLRDLYKVTSEKISQINIAKMSLEQTITDARQKIDDQWSNVDLGSINLGKTKSFSPTLKNEGKILSINSDYDFVVVDFGSINSIKDETKFVVERNGEQVATLNVLEVRDTMTACNIQELIQGKKLEVSDLVRIRK